MDDDDDQAKLTNIILSDLLLKSEYREIARPEAEVRGEDVTCQIALKPFKDNRRRSEFRQKMEQRLNNKEHPARFGVLLGGRSTIDVLKRDVNKSKALRFATRHLQLDPSQMLYFGDEFGPWGNDLPVALMADSERPSGDR